MTSLQQQPSYPSTNPIGHSAQFLKQRKALMVLPLLVIPFLFFFFASLGGGKGNAKDKPTSGAGMGFNPELPKPQLDRKKTEKSKLDLYKQADEDSLRRREYLQQDPYHARTVQGKAATQPPGNALLPEDPRADELLKRLDQLKQSIQSPTAVNPVIPRSYPEAPAIPRYKPPLPLSLPDTPDTDPQLEKLNTMLDKIIRIQHPGTEMTPAQQTQPPASPDPPGTAAAAAETNSIPAVVQQDQTLVAGATIALRLTEAATINGVPIPANQMVYGVASLNNDRLLITVNTIRRDQAIYSIALQVYDMDGIPGIHIPGTLSRDVAKQSADQGIGSINLATFDPSPGAQATNAGIQAAKTLFSRKVRMVRVSVRAGYQVLLRYTGPGGRVQLAHTAPADSVGRGTPIDSTQSFPPFMHHGTRSEKMELELQGIYLRNDILFFYLTLRNKSPIDYIPAYSRWFIRDRHQWKRTAVQEIPLKPAYASFPKVVWGNSASPLLIGFQPFALPKDKELVLQIAEKNGARELVLAVNHAEILKARKQ